MNVRILPLAELEAGDAVLWYEGQRQGLGDEFRTELDRAVGQISAIPQSCGLLEYYRGVHDIRRCILHRFPYLVIFQLRVNEVLIVAVCHARRKPLYWMDRLVR